MKGGNIFDNSYENKAIELIEKSMDFNMPLNQKSQEWYGDERAKYLKDAISELKDKIKILNDYSKGWRVNMFGNDLMFGINNNNKNNKSSNSSTKKNNSNSSNYNANNENMSGGKRHKKRYIKRTRRHRK